MYFMKIFSEFVQFSANSCISATGMWTFQCDLIFDDRLVKSSYIGSIAINVILVDAPDFKVFHVIFGN